MNFLAFLLDFLDLNKEIYKCFGKESNDMLHFETLYVILNKRKRRGAEMKTKFHEYLTMFRKQRGYTQAQMAEMLEISRSSYTNYEMGNRSPNLETLERISEILDCSLDALFGKAPVKFANMVREESNPYHVDAKKPQKGKDRRLAIGTQDFRKLRERKAYYVDKTLMIEEFLESWYDVTLITRPRRFGKTLNMSMLAEFLDCTKDSGDLFAGTRISNSYVMQEMNEHPVIFLSFLNLRGDCADRMLDQLGVALKGEYRRYYDIINDGTLPDAQRDEFNHIYELLWPIKRTKEAEACIVNSITSLCWILESYYGKKVYLLLDEYDTPFISANAQGYYSEVRGVLTEMFTSSLKGNPALERAVLTGIQRVAKENIFSGINNLSVCTVKDAEYSECFGFTEEETEALLEYCGVEFSDEVRIMYDGYLFGMAEVYNPWSVSCYAARKELEPYWVNTSENSIIKHAFEQRGESFLRKYNELIEKGTVDTKVELSVSYYEEQDDASLWGLLLNAGMVTVQEKVEKGIYKLRIPNYEVRKVFQELTAFCLKLEEGHIQEMLRYLRTEAMDKFVEQYQWILLRLPSYHDLKSENSYHMMMLGMCAFMYQHYDVRSNRESGNGRSDIILYAKKPELPHMILEFKYTKDESQDLEKLAQEAIDQIKDKKYDAEITGTVYYIGLAHFGKNAEVKWEKKDEANIFSGR